MTDWDKIYKDINRLCWAILFLLSSIGYIFMSRTFTLGIIAGGCVIIANFSFLQSTIRKSFHRDALVRVKKALLIGKSFFRLFMLGGIIYLLISRGVVDPIGLTIGLSTVMLGIVSFGVIKALKSRIEGEM
jgi:hypothetical protein